MSKLEQQLLLLSSGYNYLESYQTFLPQKKSHIDQSQVNFNQPQNPALSQMLIEVLNDFQTLPGLPSLLCYRQLS
jgi:hypothetical protein